jgi:predicted TIM-barrel fold metal-dependent hydrolase
VSARRVHGASLLALLLLLASAARAAEPAVQYYALGDFAHTDKIDAHVHVHGVADHFMAQALADNFRILTIDVDYPDYPPILQQQRDAVSLRARYPGRVAFATTFSVENFQSPEWGAATVRDLETAVAAGAVGVKMWKYIGMTLQDTDGRYVMPDDPRFEPLVAYLERAHLVLLGHQAEPLNCWLPPEKMTVRSDREYFEEHPQYYMYRHPEMPAHATILAARDRMLKAHPALLFDAVHLASLEWDVNRVAQFLDRFPGARVDLAARLVHLEYQAASRPQTVRRFLIRYQDRILYGSDEAYGPDDTDAAALKALHGDWLEDWRFLVTSEAMHSGDFAAPFHGVHLPRSVIDKIYRLNALALFPNAWSEAAESRRADARGRIAAGEAPKHP